MYSKSTSKRSSGEYSGNGKFLSELETISKALYADKTVSSRLASSTASSRSKSVDKSQLPKAKGGGSNKDSSDSKDNKKASIWSWKGLKALTHVRNRRFDCCFSLLVHSVEGLPSMFNDVCLVVHWKKRDGEQMTSPVRVYEGVAEFEEQLTHSCLVYGSRSGPHHSAKYEAKHFLLYVSVYDAPELDLGKHRIDLTRLLPMTLEELEEDKSSGKWTTSFRLSGKAKGATMNVSFGYDVVGNRNSEVLAAPNMNGGRTNKLGEGGAFGLRRTGSLPARSPVTTRSIEDIKDLHEVLPTSRSELCQSVNTLYQKLDETFDPLVEKKLGFDSLYSLVEEEKSSTSVPVAADDKYSECEGNEFSVVDKGIEESTKEQVNSENEALGVHQCAGEGLETDTAVQFPIEVDAELHIEKSTKEQVDSESETLGVHQCAGQGLETDTAIQFPVEVDAELHPSTEESFQENEDHPDNTCQKEEQSESSCNAKENDNDDYSRESLLKELEEALSRAEDLVNDELGSQDDENYALPQNLVNEELESQDENHALPLDSVNEELDSQDENHAQHQENYLEMKASYRDPGKAKSLSLDDVTDLVADEFLDMLGIEHSPFGWSSESEPESPRERLLRQFEKDALANGGLLDFEIDDDPAELFSETMQSNWGAISEDFYNPSLYENFKEMPKIEIDDPVSKTRALTMEDQETEELMREWGLNEKAFQNSPPSSGFGSPIDIRSEEPQELPPLSEGLGPFVQTKDGGFLRSMNPELFKTAKSSGSLIMQVSSPVVVPAEMGSGVMDILQGLASVGIEKLSMQANKLMPLEEITGQTIQQIAWESTPTLEGVERQDIPQHEFDTMQNIPRQQKGAKETTSGRRSSKFDASSRSKETEYVSLEDLAPLAMDKIEALSVEGLRIQSGMSDNDAPSNISAQSIGELSALKGKTADVGGSIGLDGTGGLQLLDIKDNGEDVDGLMGLSLTLDEWMKIDSGEIDEDDLASERTSKILAAHHATSLDQFHGRSKGEKRRGKSRKYGLLGNNFTVALMVQLRDPLRNYEPVGSPMLALIQVERVFIPPKPRIFKTVSLVRSTDEQEEEDGAKVPEDIIEKPKEEKVQEEQIPQYKITEVHVAGLKTEPTKKKLWGSKKQEQSGSRWLLANGMGKKNKHPLMKSKTVAKSAAPAPSSTITAQPGDSLWSISSRVHGTGAKWKELQVLNPHIRNPNLVLPANETIRLR